MPPDSTTFAIAISVAATAATLLLALRRRRLRAPLLNRPTIPYVRHSLPDGVEIVVLYEDCFDTQPTFAFSPGTGLAAAEVPQALRDRDMKPASLFDGPRCASMQFGCCLVRLPQGINVLLDTSLGTVDTPQYLPRPPAHSVPSMLRDLGLSASDIHFVVHTHLHGDHIGGNTKDDGCGGRMRVYPNAVHCVHKREYDYAQFPGCPWAADVRKKFEHIVKAGALRLLDGPTAHIDASVPQLEAVLMQGHTPGHIVVRIGSDTEGAAAIYVGDAMHFPAQVEHPEWSPHFDACCWQGGKNRPDVSWTKAMQANKDGWHVLRSHESRVALLSMLERESALLVSPHFPSPSIGRVLRAPAAAMKGTDVAADAAAKPRFTYLPLAVQAATGSVAVEPASVAAADKCGECR